MININKNENNEFILYLNEDVSINNPFYIFRFVDIYNRETIRTLTDDSSGYTYNTFSYYDGSDFSLYASGQYYVYESSVDTSIIDDLTLLEDGKYKFEIDKLGDITYDPSIQYTDYVFDPCHNGIINQDIVFDPIWQSGELPPLGIPASVILQDPSYRFVTDDQISDWDEGIDLSYIDGSIVAAIDAVDSSLVTYVDNEIVEVDASINNLYVHLEFVNYTDVVNGGENWTINNTDQADGGSGWATQNTPELSGGVFWDK